MEWTIEATVSFELYDEDNTPQEWLDNVACVVKTRTVDAEDKVSDFVGQVLDTAPNLTPAERSRLRCEAIRRFQQNKAHLIEEQAKEEGRG